MAVDEVSESRPDSAPNGNNGSNESSRVVLNIYDLTPVNNYVYWSGVGIFHSGIEVHGKEYGFGAHDFAVSGVFEVEPRTCPGFIYRCSIKLGHTKMDQSEIRALLEKMASEYHGDTYHLISKNCNHFTDDVSHKLIGKHIPGWVNRLARLGSLCSCLLPESLQVTTVKQLPEYHDCTEDGNETLSIATPRGSEISDSDDKHLLSPRHGIGEISFVKESRL